MNYNLYRKINCNLFVLFVYYCYFCQSKEENSVFTDETEHQHITHYYTTT